MKRILMILFFAWLTSANAEYNFTTVEKRGIADDIVPCQWDNQEGVPCITISKGINNSNRIGDKISPTFTITKSEIEKNNLIDLPKVLNHIQGIDVTQSGPTGQQGSVFLRGTN